MIFDIYDIYCIGKPYKKSQDHILPKNQRYFCKTQLYSNTVQKVLKKQNLPYRKKTN